MIPALSLEITVLLLGVFLLLVESFSKNADKSSLARMAIVILTVTRPVVGDDKKADDPPKPKGMLPANWKQLGLTKDHS